MIDVYSIMMLYNLRTYLWIKYIFCRKYWFYHLWTHNDTEEENCNGFRFVMDPLTFSLCDKFPDKNLGQMKEIKWRVISPYFKYLYLCLKIYACVSRGHLGLCNVEARLGLWTMLNVRLGTDVGTFGSLLVVRSWPEHTQKEEQEGELWVRLGSITHPRLKIVSSI